MDAISLLLHLLSGNVSSWMRFQKIQCQLESFKTAQVAEQIRWHECFNTAQEEGKATQRCSSGVIYTLSQFLFWCVVVEHVHTHVTGPPPVQNRAIKEQQITNCTFMMSVWAHVLSCEYVLTCPDISSGCFGNSGQSSLTQLKTAYRKMCVKESREAEKHTLGLMDRSYGTEWSEHRRREERVQNCNHSRDE